jgi:cell division protein FtsL
MRKPKNEALRRKLRNKFIYQVASIILVFSSIFIYLWSHITLFEKSYQFNSLIMGYQKLKKENKLLKLEKSELASLERVEKIAREKLGLISPRDDQIIAVVIDKRQERLKPDTLYAGISGTD